MSEELQQKLRAQLWEGCQQPARQYVSQRIYVLLVGLYLL